MHILRVCVGVKFWASSFKLRSAPCYTRYHHPHLMSTATQFTAADSRVPGATHVLLLTTGSVASIKAPLIAAALLEVSPAQGTSARSARERNVDSDPFSLCVPRSMQSFSFKS